MQVPERSTAMSLRQKINLIFAMVSTLVLGVLVTATIHPDRTAIIATESAFHGPGLHRIAPGQD